VNRLRGLATCAVADPDAARAWDDLEGAIWAAG
jgi:hypothetical protein